MTNLVGKRIGHYNVLAVLGQGGMATVYRARRSDMADDIALKVIQPELADTEIFIKRFELEAKTVIGLLMLSLIAKLFSSPHPGVEANRV